VVPGPDLRDLVVERAQRPLEPPEPAVEGPRIRRVDSVTARATFGIVCGSYQTWTLSPVLRPSNVWATITLREGLGDAFMRWYMKSSYPRPFMTARLARATAAPSTALVSYSWGSAFGSLIMLVMET
jgi:hypothetical protein